MSFLNELRSKRDKLKPTTTIVTYPDGSRKQTVSSRGSEIERNDDSSSPCYGFVVDTKPDITPACILDDFLYLGSQDAVSESNIKTFGFTDILSIGIEAPLIDLESLRPLHPVMHYISCLDLPDTKLDDIIGKAMCILTLVRNKKPHGKILIHCNAGVSRSASVCIAYLIQFEGLSFVKACEFVKSKRECIRPNDGFLRQLKEMDST